MAIKILQPSCNLETVRDGRGGIFTWVPKEPILEFNLLFFKLTLIFSLFQTVFSVVELKRFYQNL